MDAVRIAHLSSVADEAERGLFHALRSDVDWLESASSEQWRAVCEVALRTFSAALLDATSRAWPPLPALPDEVRQRLARVRAFSAARWALSLRQVEELGDALAARGVPCMVLKGAHSGRLYALPGARATGDVDLLVREVHVRAAQEVLVRLGYRADAQWEDDHPDHRHLAPYLRAGSLPVELHTTLARRREGHDVDAGVWDRAQPWGEGAALAMDPVDLLLYTCKHLAAHHGFATTNGLSGLADVKVILSKHPVDPQVLAQRSEAWGIRPSVAVCLMLARDLLGAPVPDDLWEAVAVPGCLEVAPSAVWVLLHIGGFGASRHLQWPTRATLNPPHPVAGLRAGGVVANVFRFARIAGAPPLDDLQLDHPRIPRRFARAGYPLLWSRLAWRHLGLLRLAAPTVRARIRAERAAHRKAVAAFLGPGAP